MVFLDMLQIKYPVRCSKRYNNTFFKISIIITPTGKKNETKM